jgi:hypothetical protein
MSQQDFKEEAGAAVAELSPPVEKKRNWFRPAHRADRDQSFSPNHALDCGAIATAVDHETLRVVARPLERAALIFRDQESER